MITSTDLGDYRTETETPGTFRRLLYLLSCLIHSKNEETLQILYFVLISHIEKALQMVGMMEGEPVSQSES